MEEVSLTSGLKSEDIVTEPEYARAFSDAEGADINTITLLRIYDLLGAILYNADPKMSDTIMEAHEAGRLVGPLPSLNI